MLYAVCGVLHLPFHHSMACHITSCYIIFCHIYAGRWCHAKGFGVALCLLLVIVCYAISALGVVIGFKKSPNAHDGNAVAI